MNLQLAMTKEAVQEGKITIKDLEKIIAEAGKGEKKLQEISDEQKRKEYYRELIWKLH